jgi:hypothetical protein
MPSDLSSLQARKLNVQRLRHPNQYPLTTYGVFTFGVDYMYIAWDRINTNCILIVPCVLRVLRTP